MGDPRKRRKSYSTPKHPWQKERIDLEKEISREYGTRRKKEIWKMHSIMKHFHHGAKKAASINITEQNKKEFTQLLEKGRKLGLLNQEDNTTDAVLNLTLNNIMDRRLQTLVFRKGLARTSKQARQLVVHEHIRVGGKKITSPSYLVSLEEERTLEFDPSSPISKEDHPERIQPEVIPIVEDKVEVVENKDENVEHKDKAVKNKDEVVKEIQTEKDETGEVA